jgi:hypothetical protein
LIPIPSNACAISSGLDEITSSVAKSPRLSRTHFPLITQMEGTISNIATCVRYKGVRAGYLLKYTTDGLFKKKIRNNDLIFSQKRL